MLRWIAVLPLLVQAACQSPAPSTPTATTPPTVAAPKPAAPPSPSPASSPSAAAAPKPSPVASPSPPVQAAAPPAAGAGRVEVLNAADAAFQRGDLTNASQLYERVINTPPTGENAQQTPVINQYAGFRAMLALLAAGNEDEANSKLQELQRADTNAPLARLASQLWDQYGMIGSVRGACSQLQPQITTQAGPTLQALQAMGVSADAQSLCRLPG